MTTSNEVPDTLPTALYSAEQTRQLDRVAIDEFGIPGFTLMRRAGRAAFNQLSGRWPQADTLTVFCGTGNNGGDGYVIANLARQRGMAVTVVQLGDAAKIGGDALQARQLCLHDGIPVVALADCPPLNHGVIVDALLGTGVSGDVRGEFKTAIDLINGCGLSVLAVDIPSGLCGDSGRRLGAAVHADCTATFIGLKRGLFTGDAADHVGSLSFHDLQLPDEVYAAVPATAERLDISHLQCMLPPRLRSAHKGHFGHVLVVGGDVGMAGAALMASRAAGRVGAGLVSCATRSEHVSAFVAAAPEVMVHAVDSGLALEPLLAKASVVVLGPGLGRRAWAQLLLQKVLASNLPLVVDADALNLIAADITGESPPRDNWVLTPHPGEAARLLGTDTAAIGVDRFSAIAQIQQRFGGTVVLKGAGTLVLGVQGSGKLPGVCAHGNPGMASGGMGDVLSGVLGGLIAQGLDSFDAARLGVCLHGAAADLAAVDGERGLLATDLLLPLRRLVNGES